MRRPPPHFCDAFALVWTFAFLLLDELPAAATTSARWFVVSFFSAI
jgi:hypothetical protein